MAKLFGDWKKFFAWTGRLKSAALVRLYRTDLDTLGGAITHKVRGHIMRQDLSWVPLSKRTVERKGHAKPYIESYEYASKVKARVTQVRGTVDLKVVPTGKHTGSGLQMQELAKMLEYGTSKISARPLWRPTFDEIKQMPEFANLVKLDRKFRFK